MGVRGLQGYMEKKKTWIFKSIKLSNTKIIIDGCNVYFHLYFSCLDKRHGGDYDAFVNLVRRFFEALAACNVSPVVLLDGCVDYTGRKFPTRKQRTQSNILEAETLSRGSSSWILPLMTKEVFKEVLNNLRVPFIQCVNETDREIACLANQWNCPVLSGDSDFFLFDLKGGYLPYKFFQWEHVGTCPATSEKFIPVLHFTVDNFCTHFGNMNKELLPLFAAMAGNDFTNLGAMTTFFSHINFNLSRRSVQDKIDTLFRWLSRFPGPEQALDALAQVFRGGCQIGIRSLLSSGMQDYKLSPSSLAQYFTLGAAAVDVPGPLRDLPGWVLAGLSSGELPSMILDVLVLRKTMMRTQVENFQRASSHLTSLPIRQVFYGLLLHGLPAGGPLHHVQEFDRQLLDLSESFVPADLPSGVRRLPLETLNEVAELAPCISSFIQKAPLPVRLQVLLETLRVDESVAKAGPPHLSLPVCVTCYWLNCSQPKPDLQMVQALLLGFVYGELCRTEGPEAGDRAVRDRLGRLRVAAGTREGFDLDVAHAYSQWQSCLWMSLYLNQLLCCPLSEPACAWLYSGTFAHRAVKELRGGSTPEVLLRGAPFATELYGAIQGAVWRSGGR